jgi:hypothetical protein
MELPSTVEALVVFAAIGQDGARSFSIGKGEDMGMWLQLV